MTSDIKSYLYDHAVEAFQLLEELVLIQSGSRNKSGVDRVGARIKKEMAAMGFACEISPSPVFGDTLIARSPACTARKADKSQILITGHMDTVFPENTSFNFYREDSNCCYGPGTADMKGGLVVGIHAIKALLHTGRLDTLPLCFVFNPDEEIGSPSSRELIFKEAQQSRAAFVLEAGGLSNEIVTGRKGNLALDLAIKGEAGHAAFAGKNKASAILELARKTIAIEHLNQPEKGISANVGTVNGGLGSNTVAEHASASLDFRFLTDLDAEQIKTQINRIVKEQTTPHTVCTLNTVSSRPAMPQTRANKDLFNRIQKIGATIGVPVVEELRQGVSDANNIALAGIPVIDGLGPIGAKDHSEDEYIIKYSLISRSLLFAHILAAFNTL